MVLQQKTAPENPFIVGVYKHAEETVHMILIDGDSVLVECKHNVSAFTSRVYALCAGTQDTILLGFSGPWAPGTWKKVRRGYQFHDMMSAGSPRMLQLESDLRDNYEVLSSQQHGTFWQKALDRLQHECLDDVVVVSNDLPGMLSFAMHHHSWKRICVNHIELSFDNFRTEDATAMIVQLLLFGETDTLPPLLSDNDVIKTDWDIFDPDTCEFRVQAMTSLLEQVSHCDVHNANASSEHACIYFDFLTSMMRFYTHGIECESSFPFDIAPSARDLRIHILKLNAGIAVNSVVQDHIDWTATTEALAVLHPSQLMDTEFSEAVSVWNAFFPDQVKTRVPWRSYVIPKIIQSQTK